MGVGTLMLSNDTSSPLLRYLMPKKTCADIESQQQTLSPNKSVPSARSIMSAIVKKYKANPSLIGITIGLVLLAYIVVTILNTRPPH